MAFGWTKTLRCKSNAWEDVHLPCSSSSRSLRDAIVPLPKISRFQKSQTLPKRDPNNESAPPSLASLCDLPLGHSSRRVVEIIFRSSWSPPFSGQIQMLFKVRHPPRALAIFEDRRAAIRSLSDDPRCAADGNEMMRFHPAFPTAGAIYNASVVASAFGKMEGVRTFAGSAAAHQNAGGGPGRRAVLLCRVIAGRVGNSGQPEADSARIGPGELLVFDARAVLPCFLIIYKI